MKIKHIVIFLALLNLVGCTSMWTPGIHTEQDFTSIDFSKPMRTGEACQTYVLGFIGPFGNATVREAAQDGNISKIEMVDYKLKQYVLFSKFCVVVSSFFDGTSQESWPEIEKKRLR